MLKVLHTGDVHLGDLAGPTKDGANLRRLDTLACMDSIVETAQRERPNVSIIAGDLFNRSRVWADTALDDVNDAMARFLRPLCGHSDAVVLLFGTMNHDNPRAYEVIRKATADLTNLHIYTTPQVETIHTQDGDVDIVAVPGFDKGRLRLFFPGADKETENQNATALVNDIIMGLGSGLDRTNPSILVAHYTVAGSEADNGSTFLAGQDVVVLPSTIDAARVDLACFGHIHKPQKLMSNTPAYYCGSPNQLTFNDEGTGHGFWMHEISTESRGDIHSEFIDTPERHHQTVRMSPEDVADFISVGTYAAPISVKEAIVRIRYTCTTEQEKAFNRAELQRQIMAAGAFYVAEITPEDIEELDAKDQLTEHDGPAECLARWLELNEIVGEKADRLMELASGRLLVWGRVVRCLPSSRCTVLGSAQRRRRIALVADFGGHAAPEILFIRSGVCGDSEESGAPRETAAGRAGGDACVASEPSSLTNRGIFCGGVTETLRAEPHGALPIVLNDQGGRIMGTSVDLVGTLRAQEHGHQPIVCAGFKHRAGAKAGSIGYEAETAPTLNAEQTAAVYDARGNGDGKTTCTLAGDHQSRITDYTAIVMTTGRAKAEDPPDEKSMYTMQGFGDYKMAGATSTIKASCSKAATDLVVAVDCRNMTENPEVTHTLQASAGGGTSPNSTPHIRAGASVRRLTPLECERLQGYPDGWTNIGEWVGTDGKLRKESSDAARYKALGVMPQNKIVEYGKIDCVSMKKLHE